jgi:hypothetical protein
MADDKYGHIFTTADVMLIAERIHREAQAGVPLSEIAFNLDDFTFPKGEPVFVLRAKDRKAESALHFYYDRCRAGIARSPENHLDGIERAFRAFAKFRADNPDLMKDPD